MRKLRVSLLTVGVMVGLVVAIASPANATHRYETTWSGPMILLDGVARTYRGEDLETWRAIRERVIRDYASAVPIRSVELKVARFDCGVADERRPGYVLLCSNRKDPTVGGWGGSNPHGGGAAVIVFRRLDVARYYVCHELGHVLGLDHRSDGQSCMSGWEGLPFVPSPDGHDLESLRSP
jgi:hypothetical protein